MKQQVKPTRAAYRRKLKKVIDKSMLSSEYKKALLEIELEYAVFLGLCR